MLERFSGVGAVARSGGERQRSHGGDAAVNGRGYAGKHCFRQVESVNRGEWIAFPQYSSEASLAATDVSNALAVESSQVVEHELDVRDPRIDGGRVVFLILRRLVKETANFRDGGRWSSMQDSVEPTHVSEGRGVRHGGFICGGK